MALEFPKQFKNKIILKMHTIVGANLYGSVLTLEYICSSPEELFFSLLVHYEGIRFNSVVFGGRFIGFPNHPLLKSRNVLPSSLLAKP